MATVSTLPQVKAALVTALQAAMTGTQVTHSHPGTQVMDATASVFLGDARATSIIPVSRAGRAKRQETLTLDVFIVTTGSGPNTKDAEDRAFALLGDLEDVLADDLTLGDLPIIRAFLSEWEETSLADDTRRGWLVELRATVTVEARLS